MKTSLVPQLICPECRNDLSLSGVVDQAGECSTGLLTCERGHHYPINGGVPSFLEMNMDKKQRATADSFSGKWQSVPDYGFEEKTRDFHQAWYLERYGWDSESALQSHLLLCRNILDAGMGIGRDVAWYAGLTGAQVYGVDIGESVNIAYARLGKLPNVHIIQANLLNMPFRSGFFDFAVSDFVLHHTQHTSFALARLLSHITPAGQVSFYVYRRKGEAREFSDDLLRSYTTEMSPAECLKFSEAAMQFGKSVAEISVELQRKIYWKIFKCFWNPEFSREHNISVNFDWYHPAYAWRHTPEEVEGWCKMAHVKILHENIQESGISIRGVVS